MFTKNPGVFLFFTISCIVLLEAGKPNQAISLENEVTIYELHDSYRESRYSVTEVTQFYLDRIKELNKKGPELRVVITINPDALAIAEKLDSQLQNRGVKGDLFGVPVLLKDNIDTADKMPCTAGSRVLRNSFPLKDSAVASQLRQAGAIILGKANMSELANFRSSDGSNGWSSIGGQTRNPYDLTRSPGGSSSGSAVAVSANLCVVAIGTETAGSIINPAGLNGIVGIKPTVGLISRSGIIPIAKSLDTAGPMARTVTDAAICLGVLTEVDPADESMSATDRKAYDDYTRFLSEMSLEGKRIGYYKAPAQKHEKLLAIMEKGAQFFRDRGAILVELDQVMDPRNWGACIQVMKYEFKDGLNRYLTSLESEREVNDLADLISKMKADPVEMQFNIKTLLSAQSKENLDSENYQKALSALRTRSRTEGIDKVMDEHDLIAIIAPTGTPAWKIDHINGDRFTSSVSTSGSAAMAGYPNITLPMGQIKGLPVGLSIFGRPWSEPLLLGLVFTFEQGTKHRKSPGLRSNSF